jgi:hypothetical protein
MNLCLFRGVALVILPLLVPLPETRPTMAGLPCGSAFQLAIEPTYLARGLRARVFSGAVFGARRLRFEGDVSKLNGITNPPGR